MLKEVAEVNDNSSEDDICYALSAKRRLSAKVIADEIGSETSEDNLGSENGSGWSGE